MSLIVLVFVAVIVVVVVAVAVIVVIVIVVVIVVALADVVVALTTYIHNCMKVTILSNKFPRNPLSTVKDDSIDICDPSFFFIKKRLDPGADVKSGVTFLSGNL